jgi:Txe/YoeB family toxin of toxin-antitoxin system
VKWKIVLTTQACKDAKKIADSGLKNKAEAIIEILKINPYKNPPSYEKLSGDLTGYLSRRINIQHRLIYQVYKKEKIIKIVRMWTHYE